MTFTLSIEPYDGKSYQHPYHLGTIERVARTAAEDIYDRYQNNGQAVRTVTLICDGKVFDAFNGKDWFSDTIERAVTAATCALPDHVFCLRYGSSEQVWSICVGGKVLPTTWNSRGAAQAGLRVEQRRQAKHIKQATTGEK